MAKRSIGRCMVIVAAAFACCVLAACAGGGSASSSASPPASTSSEPSGPSATSPVEASIPSESVLYLNDDEGAARLVADMQAGRIPQRCSALYDQMGGLPSVDVTDPDTIVELYEALAQMTVVGPSDMSMTDAYHYIAFTLQDGTTVGYRFEGAGLLVWDSRHNYAVSDNGGLWHIVRQLQDEEMGVSDSSARR